MSPAHAAARRRRHREAEERRFRLHRTFGKKANYSTEGRQAGFDLPCAASFRAGSASGRRQAIEKPLRTAESGSQEGTGDLERVRPRNRRRAFERLRDELPGPTSNDETPAATRQSEVG